MPERIELPEVKVLAKRVLACRTMLKESQEKFAEECGMSVDMVSLIEREMANPSIVTLSKISRHIGISVSDMLKLE